MEKLKEKGTQTVQKKCKHLQKQKTLIYSGNGTRFIERSGRCEVKIEYNLNAQILTLCLELHFVEVVKPSLLESSPSLNHSLHKTLL